MFKILTYTSESNFNMTVVKVVGERKTFEPIKLEYLVLDEDGREFYVDSSRIFDTVEDAKLSLKDKAQTVYTNTVLLVDTQAILAEEKLSSLV